ncbi:MAG: hypothetical protein QI223_03235 [Candidatus Korarchaeota archaeon]|nr:hypothetical protein [Candidatus Korarchaeota archaeon]
MPEEREAKEGPTLAATALMILMSLGLAAFSVIIIYYGIRAGSRTETPGMDTWFQVLFGVTGLMLSLKMVYDVLRMKIAPEEEEPTIVSRLQCVDCGHWKEREFREGEYVGLKAEEACPKCGGSMFVAAIYAKKPKKQARRPLF